MFKKLLKILNQQNPNIFFCLFYWSYGFCTTSHVFWSFATLAHTVNEAWKWPKIEKFDIRPLIYFLRQRGPIKFAFAYAS